MWKGLKAGAILGLALSLGVWGSFLAYPAWKDLVEATESLECFCPSCPETAVERKGIDSLGIIEVEIAGAVVKPGVYALQFGERLAALIAKAGGFRSDVDPQFIAKNLSLAALLEDSKKYYIPFLTELEAASTPVGNNTTVVEQIENSSSENCISINTASQKQLESLTGIGTKRAGDIITQRPYGSLNELVSTAVITQSIFENIQEEICL